MSHCGECGGCANCGGCGGSLLLSPLEMEILQSFAQLPFQPVVRRADSQTPVSPDHPGEEASLALECLEKKGLVDLDYHTPLSGWDDSAWRAYPLRGSAALTARGQQALELLELQGFGEE